MQDRVGCTVVHDRAFERRYRARRTAGIRSRALRAAAVFALSGLFVGLAVPLVGLVLPSEPAPHCCSKGRCCCADDAAGRDDRTCLRRGCGCECQGEAVTEAVVEIDAIVPAGATVAPISPREAAWSSAPERPLPRSDEPPVPPPRRSPLA